MVTVAGLIEELQEIDGDFNVQVRTTDDKDVSITLNVDVLHIYSDCDTVILEGVW